MEGISNILLTLPRCGPPKNAHPSSKRNRLDAFSTHHLGNLLVRKGSGPRLLPRGKRSLREGLCLNKTLSSSPNYFPRCVSHNTACTGDLHCVQLAALRAPVSARNAGAVMLQAGRHRASTHKEVDVSAFHARAFAARGNWIVIGTQRVLRFGPYPPHWIIFALALACPCLRWFCADL